MPIFNDATISERLNDALKHVCDKNADQAELFIDDLIEDMDRDLRSTPRRDKGAESYVVPATSSGISRSMAVRRHCGSARQLLALGRFEAAAVELESALREWERGSKPNPQA